MSDFEDDFVPEDCFQDFDVSDFDLTDDTLLEEEVPDLNEIEFKTVSGNVPACEKYPAIFVDGIDTEEEFLFFRNQKPDFCQDETLPLYCMVEGELVLVGSIAFNLQTLLDLGYVSQYYKVFLLEKEGQKKEIDVRNPDILAKYITF